LIAWEMKFFILNIILRTVCQIIFNIDIIEIISRITNTFIAKKIFSVILTKNRNCRLLILSFCSFLYLSSCSDRKELINNTDPYLQAFWNKGLRYMISVDGIGQRDTTSFDSLGNIIQIKRGSSIERYTYNSNRFMTRL
jgi:hypothetical protein